MLSKLLITVAPGASLLKLLRSAGDTAGDDAGGGGDTQAQLMNAIKSGAGSLRRVEPSAEPKAFTPRTGRVL